MKRLREYGEKNYAAKERKLEKGDLGKHTHRSPCRKTAEASSSHCHVQSGQKQEEVRICNDQIRPKDAHPTESPSGDGEVTSPILAVRDLPKGGTESGGKTRCNSQSSQGLQNEKKGETCLKQNSDLEPDSKPSKRKPQQVEQKIQQRLPQQPVSKNMAKKR